MNSRTGQKGRPVTRNVKATCKAVTVRLPIELLDKYEQTKDAIRKDKTNYISDLIKADMDANYGSRMQFIGGELTMRELDALQGADCVAHYLVYESPDVKRYGQQDYMWSLKAQFTNEQDAQEYIEYKQSNGSRDVYKVVDHSLNK